MKNINMKKGKSKFKVGSSVFMVYKKGDRYHLYEGMCVIEKVSYDKLGYHYSITNSDEDVIDWCRDEDLFRSDADALREIAARGK